MRIIAAFAAGCLISSFATLLLTTNSPSEQPLPQPSPSMSLENSGHSAPTNCPPAPESIASNNIEKPQEKNDTQEINRQALPDGNSKTENLVRTIRSNLEQVEKFRDLRKLDGENAVLQTVSSNYKKEKVNHEWAAKTRNTINEVFQSEQKLAVYTPSNVNCRSESCQITVSVSNGRNIEDVYDGFRSAISQKDGLKQSQISYFRDKNKGNLVMYLSSGSLSQLTKIDN